MRIFAILQSLAPACVRFTRQYPLLEAWSAPKRVQAFQKFEQRAVTQLSDPMRVQVIARHEHGQLAIRIGNPQPIAQFLDDTDASFFVGQALLSGQHLEASLTDPGALRSVFGAALYLTVAGVTALAGAVLLDGTFGIAHPLTPWTGFAVMCGFAVVLTGLAARRLRRGDA